MKAGWPGLRKVFVAWSAALPHLSPNNSPDRPINYNYLKAVRIYTSLNSAKSSYKDAPLTTLTRHEATLKNIPENDFLCIFRTYLYVKNRSKTAGRWKKSVLSGIVMLWLERNNILLTRRIDFRQIRILLFTRFLFLSIQISDFLLVSRSFNWPRCFAQPRKSRRGKYSATI